jgi:hypothetical protein
VRRAGGGEVGVRGGGGDAGRGWSSRVACAPLVPMAAVAVVTLTHLVAGAAPALAVAEGPEAAAAAAATATTTIATTMTTTMTTAAAAVGSQADYFATPHPEFAAALILHWLLWVRHYITPI